MKNYKEYICEVNFSRPCIDEFITVKVVLKNSDGDIVDTKDIKKSEYDPVKFKNYESVQEFTDKVAFENAKKDYEKKCEEYKNKLIALKEKYLNDIAEDMKTTIDIVKKAIKCLDFCSNEYEDFSDHLQNFSSREYECYDEHYFGKRTEIIKEFVSIIKD